MSETFRRDQRPAKAGGGTPEAIGNGTMYKHRIAQRIRKLVIGLVLSFAGGEANAVFYGNDIHQWCRSNRSMALAYAAALSDQASRILYTLGVTLRSSPEQPRAKNLALLSECLFCWSANNEAALKARRWPPQTNLWRERTSPRTGSVRLRGISLKVMCEKQRTSTFSHYRRVKRLS
jgi:hypothetical protein